MAQTLYIAHLKCEFMLKVLTPNLRFVRPHSSFPSISTAILLLLLLLLYIPLGIIKISEEFAIQYRSKRIKIKEANKAFKSYYHNNNIGDHFQMANIYTYKGERGREREYPRNKGTRYSNGTAGPELVEEANNDRKKKKN